MRVLVCDDSAVVRKALGRIIASEPGLSLLDTARDGREAVDKAVALRPDLITLDIEMPELDGLAALAQIMSRAPTRVLMVSNLTKDGTRAALAALRLGAMDVVAKEQSPLGGIASGAVGSSGFDALAAQILAKVRILREAPPPVPIIPACTVPDLDHGGPHFRPGRIDAVLVGASTGGPPALEQMLAQIPSSMSCPIVIAQHMPEMFTRSMAERLDQRCALTVVHGEDAMPLVRGRAYIIPGGRHGRIRRTGNRLELEVSPEPASALYKPSVNELFASGARTLKARALGVVLTGMGDDGLLGAQELADAGAKVLAQSPESCVIYGMPKGITAHGLAEASLTPTQIGRCLATLSPTPSENRTPGADPRIVAA